MLKIAILAEKFATDYSWYVDVILNLIRVAGDYIADEVGGWGNNLCNLYFIINMNKFVKLI